MLKSILRTPENLKKKSDKENADENVGFLVFHLLNTRFGEESFAALIGDLTEPGQPTKGSLASPCGLGGQVPEDPESGIIRRLENSSL